MYADDSIMCCLFPNRCNMFPQTPVVIFSNTMEYLNMMIVLSSPIFIIWSLFRIVIQFIELDIKQFQKKDNKLIEHYSDSEDSCIKEQSLQKEVKMKCMDEYYSDDNNYDGDGYKSCSDSDLNLGPAHSISRRLGEHDESNSDVYNSKESSEDFIQNINMAPSRKSCINSVKQYSNSSSSDDREDCDHLKDFEYRACTLSTSSVVIEEEFLQAIQEDTNNDKPKDTLPVSDTDSINQQQRQNKLSNDQT